MQVIRLSRAGGIHSDRWRPPQIRLQELGALAFGMLDRVQIELFEALVTSSRETSLALPIDLYGRLERLGRLNPQGSRA